MSIRVKFGSGERTWTIEELGKVFGPENVRVVKEPDYGLVEVAGVSKEEAIERTKETVLLGTKVAGATEDGTD